MTIVGWFWLSFVATVVTMALALASGLKRRRRHHLWLGPLSLACLTVAIILTERLAAARTFPAEQMGVHLMFAKSAAFLALPVILSGVALLFMERVRTLHRIVVYLFLLGVLIATATGIWVFSLSTPK